MAKKFGKFLMVTAVLGAAAAGAYYYLQNRDRLTDEDFDEDDDLDDFDDDLDDETSKETDRNYVDLDLEKAEEFKEGLKAATAEATDKVVGAVKETAEKTADTVKKAANKTEVKVEEFFDDDDNDGSMDAM